MATATEQIDQSRAEIRDDITTEIQEQKDFNARVQEAAARARAEKQPLYESERVASEDLAQAAQKIPELKPVPVPPNIQQMTAPTTLQKQFGMAAIFALFATGITKDRGGYALRALGGFMKGAREGNMEQAEAAIKDFNTNMAAVHASNEQALRQYNAIIASKKLTLEAKDRILKIKMNEFGDEMFAMELEQKGMKGVHALINQRAKMDHDMQMELLRTKQIEAQIAHQRAMEARADARAARAEKQGAAALKQSDIAKIEDQARMEISAALPRDQLGNIVLGPDWGKTVEERAVKFQKLVDKRKNEIANQRGMTEIFQRSPEAQAAKEDPAAALRYAISSGEIKKDTQQAMNYLTTKFKLSPPQAAAVIKQVADESEY
jgi:hypothetical protein